MNMNRAAQFVFATTMTWGVALAADVNVNVELGGRAHKERVVVVPVTERVWVPDAIIQRTERVLVRSARIEKREETVCVREATTVRREEQVLVEPARVERVVENIQISPARIEREWVPPVVERIRLGCIRFDNVVREGYYRDVPIPAEYRSQIREYSVPAKYQTVCRNVEIPAKYERVYKTFEIPAEYQDITRNVLIPGHYETRTVEVKREELRRGTEVEIDLKGIFKDKHKEHDRDNDRDHDRR